MTAGTVDPACRYLYLRPVLGVDLLFISRFHSLNRTRRQPFCLATRPRFSASGVADRIVSFLIYATIGYFLIELNNQFSIIRMRASMQTAIYFLLVTVCPKMHYLYTGDIVALGFLISILFFCLKAISKLKLRVIYSTPSSLSEREVFCSHSSPSSRCFGCSKPTVSSRSLRVVSAVRCSDGCCHTGCCSDTPSSTTRWSCSIALSISY